MKFRFLLAVFFLEVFLSLANQSAAQSYGLGFDSYEVVQDKRTGLDLSPDNTFCFEKDFELCFDLSFLTDKKIYFGYILRMIENDRQNIDLVCDNSTDNPHFKLVIGDKFSSYSFDFPNDDLYKKWNRISLKFIRDKKSLQITYGKKTFSQPLTLSEKPRFKILFGANTYKDFKSTDVPPMKIRNIVISENNEPVYRFPLNQTDTDQVTEEIQKKNGLVSNPVWIKKLHYEWQLARSQTLPGYVRLGFDASKGTLYMLCSDSTIAYNLASNRSVSYKHAAGQQPVYVDDQLLFDQKNSKLYHIYTNEKQVSTFDLKTNSWDKQGPAPVVKTQFLLANKFYSPQDSSIYIMGGYGHLTYKNNVQRYHLPSGVWTEHYQKDSVFTPRYLAALGAGKNGAYMLGGYGSVTGQQILNPRNWYDLLFFDTKSATFTRRYELPAPKEDFVFCNSLIVCDQENSFYSLIFPKDKFNSDLQLIKGSLTKPDFQPVGSKIPYQFTDIHSFADLFFDYATNRFVAVALNHSENGQTKVSVYTLNAPPLQSIESAATRQTAGADNLWWILAAAVCLISGVYIYYRVSARGNKPAAAFEPQAATPATVPTEIENKVPAHVATADPATTQPLHSSVFLFGNLQLFDQDGQEITRQFSPLVKELFLVILLYTIRWEGISSEKLKELLWFDKTSESARNNRSVNIAKLKGILDKMKYCQVSKETGYWKINIDYEKIHVDYTHYLSLIRNKKSLSREKIVELAAITKRGNFLANVEYEWLDSFKSEISNEIIDSYLGFAATMKIAQDAEFLVELANYVFYFDPVNEEAMIIKCKALAHLGKHSLAKTTYENFAREYSRIYGEDFQMDMPEVLLS
ncbi:galactose oxidase [Dyadobacter luteus]|jgi:two-component SAPR family response regulator|uniref:Galactose oxidase n=1 Tax=Dyadobacter luteus TaxID=2259619 RepID=A0A3D8YHT6_9BACT|nr:galactose oxidase [Dyadobacter luteus]REA62879.1 galactose oxidase [Dyadobacter luteus]